MQQLYIMSEKLREITVDDNLAADIISKLYL